MQQLLSCLKPASDPQKSETDLIDLPRHVKIDLDIIIIIIIIIITKTMFMVLSSWQSHCESSPGSFDECRMAPSGRRPKTKPDDLRCESACTGCQKLHPPSPFIIITRTESSYSFYRPTEGRRLSWPSWLVTYQYGLPVHRRSPIRILTGSGVWRNYVDRGQIVTTKPNLLTY